MWGIQWVCVMGDIGWVCMGGIGWVNIEHGCTITCGANFMDHGSSKTPAGLVSNTTGLGSTQTTLLEYHMQEWIGHMHYMIERPGLCLFITALVGFIPGPVAGGFHLVCIQSAIYLYQCIDK